MRTLLAAVLIFSAPFAPAQRSLESQGLGVGIPQRKAGTNVRQPAPLPVVYYAAPVEPPTPPGDPLYLFNGKVFSRTRLGWLRSQSQLTDHKIDFVVGTVVRVVTNGTVVSIEDGGTLEKGKPVMLLGLGGFADREALALYAVEKSLAEYVTPLGGVRTVRSYATGGVPTAADLENYRKEEQARQKVAAELAAKTQQFRADYAAKVKGEADARMAAADAKAVASYRKRADAGDAESQYELALRHLSGKGVAKDEKEAARLLKLAAAQGHKAAQKQLNGMTPAIK